MRRAYDHGRLDERSHRRGGFGPLGFILVLVAAVGVILVVFAIREGSFSAGGAVVDNKLVQATSSVALRSTTPRPKPGRPWRPRGRI